jgi:PhnB protein
MPFQPYLFFGGNCRQAFTRYQEIFGGELVLMPLGDVPGSEAPPEQADLIIHAALTFADHLLMRSDDPMNDPYPPVQGMMVSYTAADVTDAQRVFDALTAGGEVRQALTETFFAPAFGMCLDGFGTPWMITTEPATP